MGLIRAAKSAVSGVMAEQWKEFFTCDALPNDVLIKRGEKRTSSRSTNRYGTDSVISSGSVISVAEGQCMLITDQGEIVEMCAEPGAFIYDSSTEPSVFAGDLGPAVGQVFKQICKRFTFGGEPPRDQRVYYVNTRRIDGNKYGTPNPLPVRISDAGINKSFIMPIRCFGEYSYKITNPPLFFSSVSGNVAEEYTRDKMDSQLKSELLTHLGPAFAKLSAQGVSYDQLIGHTLELRDILSQELSKEWLDGRGIEIVSFGISSLKGDEKIEAKLLNAQLYGGDPSMLAAEMGLAQAEAMKMAASNENAGSAMAFMGMNMAGQMGGATVTNLFQQGQQMNQQRSTQAAADSWDCPCGQRGNTGRFCSGCGKPKSVPVNLDSWICTCGATATGKFCPECGAKRPETPAGWTCPSCGKLNKGRFCSECGAKKPAGVPQYRCDKCGWEPADPAHPPKFCPECGDPFDDGDIQK